MKKPVDAAAKYSRMVKLRRSKESDDINEEFSNRYIANTTPEQRAAILKFRERVCPGRKNGGGSMDLEGLLHLVASYKTKNPA